MRSWLTRMVVGTVAVAAIAAAPLALASPHQHHATKHRVVHAKRATDSTASEKAGESAGENSSETAGEAGGSESPSDTAQQNAACAGKGDNVQYDPSTGCSTDAGGGPNDQTQQ